MLSLLKKYKTEIDKCDLIIHELKEEIENLKKDKKIAVERLVEVLKKNEEINEETKKIMINKSQQ